jgi:hypothetical protein
LTVTEKTVQRPNLVDHEKRFQESAVVFGEIMRLPTKASHAIYWIALPALLPSRI